MEAPDSFWGFFSNQEIIDTSKNKFALGQLIGYRDYI